MNLTNYVKNYGYDIDQYTDKKIVEKPMNQLPLPFLLKIISYLSAEDLKHTQQVSHYWKYLSSLFFNPYENNKKTNCARKIQSSTYKLTENVLNILKMLPESRLKEFEKAQLASLGFKNHQINSNSFDNIFTLTRIEKIFDKLAENNFDEALKIADKTLESQPKEEAFRHICMTLILNNSFNEFLKAIDKIFDDNELAKENFLKDILEKLALTGSYNALAQFKQFADKINRRDILNIMLKILTQKDSFNQSPISNLLKNKLKSDIQETLSQSDHIDRCQEVKNTIANKYTSKTSSSDDSDPIKTKTPTQSYKSNTKDLIFSRSHGKNKLEKIRTSKISWPDRDETPTKNVRKKPRSPGVLTNTKSNKLLTSSVDLNKKPLLNNKSKKKRKSAEETSSKLYKKSPPISAEETSSKLCKKSPPIPVLPVHELITVERRKLGLFLPSGDTNTPIFFNESCCPSIKNDPDVITEIIERLSKSKSELNERKILMEYILKYKETYKIAEKFCKKSFTVEHIEFLYDCSYWLKTKCEKPKLDGPENFTTNFNFAALEQLIEQYIIVNSRREINIGANSRQALLNELKSQPVNVQNIHNQLSEIYDHILNFLWNNIFMQHGVCDELIASLSFLNISRSSIRNDPRIIEEIYTLLDPERNKELAIDLSSPIEKKSQTFQRKKRDELSKVDTLKSISQEAKKRLMWCIVMYEETFRTAYKLCKQKGIEKHLKFLSTHFQWCQHDFLDVPDIEDFKPMIRNYIDSFTKANESEITLSKHIPSTILAEVKNQLNNKNTIHKALKDILNGIEDLLWENIFSDPEIKKEFLKLLSYFNISRRNINEYPKNITRIKSLLLEDDGNPEKIKKFIEIIVTYDQTYTTAHQICQTKGIERYIEFLSDFHHMKVKALLNSPKNFCSTNISQAKSASSVTDLDEIKPTPKGNFQNISYEDLSLLMNKYINRSVKKPINISKDIRQSIITDFDNKDSNKVIKHIEDIREEIVNFLWTELFSTNLKKDYFLYHFQDNLRIF